jgi:hypothetical protein
MYHHSQNKITHVQYYKIQPLPPTKQIPRQAPHKYVTHTNLQTLQLRSEILTNASYFNNLGFNTFNLCDAQTQYKPSFLTFIGPRIVIYFYSTANQMHNISNLFYFGTALYMFRTVSPSIIRSLRLYRVAEKSPYTQTIRTSDPI